MNQILILISIFAIFLVYAILKAIFEAIGKLLEPSPRKIEIRFEKIRKKFDTNLRNFINEMAYEHYRSDRGFEELAEVYLKQTGLNAFLNGKQEILANKPFFLYKNYVKSRLISKHRDLKNSFERAEKARIERERLERIKRIEATARGVTARNSELLQKFYEIAFRKVSFVDEYGDISKAAYYAEREKFFTSKLRVRESVM